MSLDISSSLNFSRLPQNSSFSERAKLWIHDHPTAVKVAKVAATVIAVAILATLPFSAPFVATGVVVSLAVTAMVLAIGSIVAHIFLDSFAPPHHDMKTHMFKPGECENGKLFYDGDVPVLTLESDDPFKAGKAYGFLCGEAINILSSKLDFMIHSYGGFSRASDLEETVKKFHQTIPNQYLLEMEGLVEGYNSWSAEQSMFTPTRKLTVDDIILINLYPDLNHFNLSNTEKSLLEDQKTVDRTDDQDVHLEVGCSVLIDQDKSGSMVFSRNLDWASYGKLGAYSIVINRKYNDPKKRNTVEVGIPSIVGTLTGMNDKGLSLAMNVCANYTNEVKGPPACIYNRMCLESCKSVQEVDTFTKKSSPLGAYHLSVADKYGAEVFHFFQRGSRNDFDGSYDFKSSAYTRKWHGNPLITLNRTYSSSGWNEEGFNNEGRKKVLDNFFQNRGTYETEDALSLAQINRPITLHSVVMKPESKTFKVVFDNAYAASSPMHIVDTRNLLAK